MTSQTRSSSFRFPKMKQNVDAVNILPAFDASSDVSLNPSIRLNIGQYIPGSPAVSRRLWVSKSKVWKGSKSRKESGRVLTLDRFNINGIYFINLNSNHQGLCEGLLTKTNGDFSSFYTRLCLFICLLKELGSEQAKSHWLHLFDFSPLCVFKWVLKLPAQEEA